MSSKKAVPPSARCRALTALRGLNKRGSRSVSSSEHRRLTNGARLRTLWRWINLASRFLPTPYSPAINTRIGARDASAISCCSSRAAALDPTRIPAISPGLRALEFFTVEVESNQLATAPDRASRQEIRPKREPLARNPCRRFGPPAGAASDIRQGKGSEGPAGPD